MGELPNSRIIVLVGPKHSGKTSAGLVLAALLAGEFIDLDALIEAQTGKSPRLLYTEGPDVFKEAETQALESLIPPESRRCRRIAPDDPGRAPAGMLRETAPHDMPEETFPEPERGILPGKGGTSPIRIIAAGGGIIDNPKAMALLKRPGGPLLIYPEVSAETAWARICLSVRAGKGLPPFLDTGTPRETHRQLHDRRAAAYKDCAHLTVAAGEKTPETIGREILSLLEMPGE
jgi:shikimate kinase